MGEKDFTYEIMRDLSGYFKPGQRKALYNAADSLRDKVLIRLLWVSTRRIGEILTLKVSDINFEDGLILWHIEKKTAFLKDLEGKRIIKEDGKPEKVKKDLTKLKPCDDFTLRLLQYYIQQYNFVNTDYLFPSSFKENLKPITRQRAFQIVRRLGKKAGVEIVGEKKIHPHHFRHTRAIDFAKRMKTPADLRKLQMVLEHESIGMTEQYLQFGDVELQEMMEEVED